MRRKTMELVFKVGFSLVIGLSLLTYFLMEHQMKQMPEAEQTELVHQVKAVVGKEMPAEPSKSSNKLISNHDRDRIHLAIVACGDDKYLEESLVALKSAVILARKDLYFHIFTDDRLKPLFIEKIDTWPSRFRSKVKLTLYPITYPSYVNYDEWKRIFKMCATQRIFLPDILPNIDSVIYIDTDVLFMRPIDDLWDHFTKFNTTQIAALAPESEDKATGWYNRFARHPYYGPLGVNSGVMLMNLTGMRAMGWVEKMVAHFREYKLMITWGDQDLINILFHYHPDKLYIFPCEWNYRTDHCMYMSVCRSAEKTGVMMLHGSRAAFQNDKQLAFKAVYQSFRDHPFDADLEKLLVAMEVNLESSKGTPCHKISHIFYKKFQEYVTAGPPIQEPVVEKKKEK
ncbi:glucoside xylosyltransferase 2-like isoform X2 [Lineus longissimus]|uniref:glucoside xylosyltransferase 2-like isoform X2 n=1 Tax=Lineus longissimus TaxID=88925 RepID=UPI002B4E43B9